MDAAITPRDRLSFTVFLAASLHAALILGVGFAWHVDHARAPTIEVTLAQHDDRVAPDKAEAETKSDPAEPTKFGEIAANFVKAGIAPEQLRRIDYGDFVAVVRALRDTGKSNVEPPSEDEYQDMIARLASKKNG